MKVGAILMKHKTVHSEVKCKTERYLYKLQV